MKINKYVAILFFFAFVILNETAPFLYNEDYTIKDMKWGWIIGFPLILLIANSFVKNDKEE